METTLPRLLFEGGFSDEDAFWMEKKGFCQCVVELPSGAQFGVSFYDPVTLAQDLEILQRKSGEVCVAPPGLIVVPSVTRSDMQAAVNQLLISGFFEHMVPLTARIE